MDNAIDIVEIKAGAASALGKVARKIDWVAVAEVGLAYVAVVAVATLVERVIRTWHHHACFHCGKRWSHSAFRNAGSIAAHTCPTCGNIELAVALEGERVHVQAPRDLPRDGSLAEVPPEAPSKN